MGSLAFPVQRWFRFLNNVRLRRLGVGYSLSDIDLEVVYEEPEVLTLKGYSSQLHCASILRIIYSVI